VSGGGGNYEIRIKGQLSDFLLAAFEGLSTTVEPVQTVLHGPVRDQAALRGLLDASSRSAWTWSKSDACPRRPANRTTPLQASWYSAPEGPPGAATRHPGTARTPERYRHGG
jgi:hypothetical protein